MDRREYANEIGWWKEFHTDGYDMVAVPKDKHIFDKDIVPCKWGVCQSCDGHGGYVNPSIDSNGISSEEWWDMDEEFRQSYMRGDYDITCQECKGKRVSPVPYYEEDQRKLDAWHQAEYEYRMEREAERRMGC